MDPHQITFLLMLGLVAFVLGLAKGGLGGVLGSVAAPLLSLVMPVGQVIGLLLPLLMVADIPAVGLYWKQWDWKWVRLMLPGAAAGVVAATFFIVSVPSRLLQIALGVIVLLFTVYKLAEKRILAGWNYQPEDWHGFLAGALSGLTSALAHNGGPPVTIYLLMQKNMTVLSFNATCAIFFAILNLVKLPFYLFARLIDPGLLARSLWVIPLMLLGVWLGVRSAQRFDAQTFERLILALLAMTAIVLIFV
ncbi:MAG TPA: sulfite exporter TauE/SafE family protein [Anaerolineaceae bacterium]|nr:sulfite exporter TauE/SafE family protein [Anaerolineaceae bacterium]